MTMVFKVTENIATCGIGHEIISIDTRDGKGFLNKTDFYIVDIRDMIKDEDDQPLDVYEKTINYAIDCLIKHKKIVIGCSAGQSRSNAIAIGVLMKRYCMNFYDAYRLVRDNVPIANIAPCHISALKQLFKVNGLP